MSVFSSAGAATVAALSTVTTSAVMINRAVTTADNYLSIAEAHSQNAKESYIAEASDLSLIHAARRRASIMQELEANPALKAIYLELKAARQPTPAT